MEGAVLIISTALDTATDAVEEELTRRKVPVVRFNSEKYPFGSNLTYKISKQKLPILDINDQQEFRNI